MDPDYVCNYGNERLPRYWVVCNQQAVYHCRQGIGLMNQLLANLRPMFLTMRHLPLGPLSDPSIIHIWKLPYTLFVIADHHLDHSYIRIMDLDKFSSLNLDAEMLVFLHTLLIQHPPIRNKKRMIRLVITHRWDYRGPIGHYNHQLYRRMIDGGLVVNELRKIPLNTAQQDAMIFDYQHEPGCASPPFEWGWQRIVVVAQNYGQDMAAVRKDYRPLKQVYLLPGNPEESVPVNDWPFFAGNMRIER
ncbi:unnamed protein product, partial [Mesorhabditis spiculigera]